MMQSILRIMVSPEKRNATLELLKSINGPIQVKPGCISCRIYQDLEDKNCLAMMQEWESEAELHNFIRSGDYQKILALIDLSRETPEIQFNTVSNAGGIEFIERASGKKAL